MAYEMFFSGGNLVTVRCTSGKESHLRQSEDGKWSVDEDPSRRAFNNRGEALDCARELAEDPDFR